MSAEADEKKTKRRAIDVMPKNTTVFNHMPIPLDRIAGFLSVTTETVIAKADEWEINRSVFEGKPAVDAITCECLIEKLGRTGAEVSEFIARANVKPKIATVTKLPKDWKRKAAIAYSRATPRQPIEYAPFALRINTHTSAPAPVQAPVGFLKNNSNKRRSPSPFAKEIRAIARDLELQAE
ncbi:MAG TPA: hypothetical protein VGF13_10820, partial [Verrucomicrobiae bacterium]